MVFRKICPPALIYLVFSITQVGIDTFQGMYNLAFVKLWVALIFTILLNFLCEHGLGVISWIIVFVPFILMTVIVSMLLVMFGLNPATGKIKSFTPKKRHKRHYYSSGSYYDDYSGEASSEDARMKSLNERQERSYERQKGRRYGDDRRHRDPRHHDDRRHHDPRHHDDRRHHDPRHHDRRHHGRDNEELSGPQKHVLDDMVQQRTGLSRDPLHHS